MRKVLFLLAFAPFLPQSYAQGPSVIPPNAVVTDGSQNPSAIPDAVAMRMFYLTAIPKSPVNASTTAFTPAKSQTAFIATFSKADQTVLLNHIASWAQQYPHGVANPVTSEQLTAQAGAELAALQLALSADGWSKLMTELTKRKKNIKIYTVPSMDMPK
jgi:hypothetical protein